MCVTRTRTFVDYLSRETIGIISGSLPVGLAGSALLWAALHSLEKGLSK